MQGRFGTGLNPRRMSSPRWVREAISTSCRCWAGTTSSRRRRLPGLRARRRLRGPPVRRVAADRGARLPAQPRRGAGVDLARDHGPVAQLPEHADGRDRAARALRAGRGPRPRADFVLASDEAYSSCTSAAAARLGAPALRPAQRRGLRHAVQRSSMPGYRSGFVAGDSADRAAQALPPNVGVAPQAFVQRAAVAAWATRRTSRRSATPTAPSATCSCPCSRPRPAQRRRRRDVLPLARRRPARRPARRAAARGRIVLAPGSFFGDAAAATCGWRSCRRSRSASAPPSASTSYCDVCRAALRPLQRPLRGSASIAPVCELRGTGARSRRSAPRP